MTVFYHYRVTCSPEESIDIAEQFIEKFSPKLFIFCQEVSKKGVPHFHAHLEWDNDCDVPSKSTRCDWHSEMGLSGLTNFEKVKKTREANLIYVTKCDDRIVWNLSDDEYEQLKQKNMLIEEDKGRDIKEKLINEVKPMVASFNYVSKKWDDEVEIEEVVNSMSLRDIARIIKDVYINKYDKLPPTKSLMFQYSVYVAQKLEICQLELSQIYDNIF